MMFGLRARIVSTSMPKRCRTSGRWLGTKTSAVSTSLYSSSRPSSVEMSRPTERLPRLGISIMKFTSPPPGTSPEEIRPRCGSTVCGCSILMTSAPHSASTAPEMGTNVHAATSTTRIPANTSCMSSPLAVRGGCCSWRSLFVALAVVSLSGVRDLELDEPRHLSRLQELTAQVQHDLVGRAEQPLERHRALQVPVVRVVGREADPGEHLLAVHRHDPGRAPGLRARERGSDRARLVPRRGEGRFERLDRHEGRGQAMPPRLELRRRSPVP